MLAGATGTEALPCAAALLRADNGRMSILFASGASLAAAHAGEDDDAKDPDAIVVEPPPLLLLLVLLLLLLLVLLLLLLLLLGMPLGAPLVASRQSTPKLPSETCASVLAGGSPKAAGTQWLSHLVP